MNPNKIFLNLSLIFLALLACLPQACAAINIKIDINPEFFTGDVISFNYTIDSDAGQMISYIESVDCPNAPHALLEEKSALVNLGVQVRGKYNYLKVADDIWPQECTAYVTVLEPSKKTVSKNFAIITTTPFKFNILLSKKIFMKGEEININYTSEVDYPSVEAILTYPDKSKKQIDLPYSFKAKDIGTYKLEVNASKEGYKEVSIVQVFGVIKNNANIEYASLSSQSVADNKSDWFKKTMQEDTTSKILKYIFYLLVIFILIVLIIIINEILKKFKSRKTIAS
jgi:hypothetical protein